METTETEIAETAGPLTAWGWGLASTTYAGDVLDTWFPTPALGEPSLGQAIVAPHELQDLVADDEAREVRTSIVLTITELSEPPSDASDVYLRLHLLSHRLVKPNSLNLDGIFAKLANVVWTDAGPCAVEGFEQTRLRLRARGRLAHVHGVDKFPRMTDYVVPSGVRIANADRVRLGAHLAAGTTVMHEGFVNYNAGTLGVSMVEGRISQGVVVGDGADIGGGASIMGTLSGGGTTRVEIGKGALLGANSGTGISLGEGTVIEAGTYITAGTKVTLPDGDVVKAQQLSGVPNLLFRRNSQTGTVEASVRSGTWGSLNSALHAND